MFLGVFRVFRVLRLGFLGFLGFLGQECFYQVGFRVYVSGLGFRV